MEHGLEHLVDQARTLSGPVRPEVEDLHRVECLWRLLESRSPTHQMTDAGLGANASLIHGFQFLRPGLASEALLLAPVLLDRLLLLPLCLCCFLPGSALVSVLVMMGASGAFLLSAGVSYARQASGRMFMSIVLRNGHVLAEHKVKVYSGSTGNPLVA